MLDLEDLTVSSFTNFGDYLIEIWKLTNFFLNKTFSSDLDVNIP